MRLTGINTQYKYTTMKILTKENAKTIVAAGELLIVIIALTILFFSTSQPLIKCLAVAAAIIFCISAKEKLILIYQHFVKEEK